ncbi:MAG: hypothetical protein AAGA56_09450 [Myxococcota bacterium]
MGCGDKAAEEAKKDAPAQSETMGDDTDKANDKTEPKTEKAKAKPNAAAADEAAKAPAATEAKGADGAQPTDAKTEREDAPERAACGALNDVPAIPATESDVPSLDDWKTACEVNTQGGGTHPDDCEMKIHEEWLRVSCRGNYTSYEKMENFGAKGADFFELVTRGSLISFVVRLKKGRSQKVRMCNPDKGRASLFVSWPPTADKPLHVALARGSKCDNK